MAAGLVTAAIGSDGAGSIRIPAAWTHLVGIKPQRGRISTWPLPEAFNGITVNGVLARTVADAALVLDAASGNVEGDRHKPPPITASDYVGEAPGPLNIALSTRFPYTGFRPKLHPEILAATRAVGKQLELLGHTVVPGNPDYGMRLSWDFLARSTSGLRDWEERLGDGVVLDPRTLSNLRMGAVLGQAILRSARRHEAADQRRVGSIFDIVDVVLAPTTAQPPPLARAFDRLSGFGTDRAMIAACPLTFPWNVLGWPSINVPAGFTSDGLPIGVQLMGPANSEGMLISLAAELEAVCGWASQQPQSWWDQTSDAARRLRNQRLTSPTRVFAGVAVNAAAARVSARHGPSDRRTSNEYLKHAEDLMAEAVGARDGLLLHLRQFAVGQGGDDGRRRRATAVCCWAATATSRSWPG